MIWARKDYGTMTEAEIVTSSAGTGYEAFLPEHLRDIYRDGLNDVQLTSLRRQVALLELRIKTLLQMLDQQVIVRADVERKIKEEFPYLDKKDAEELSKYVASFLPQNYVDHRTFGRLEALIDRYERSMMSNQVRNAEEALRQLFEMIRDGKRVGDVWDELRDTMEAQRKLGESEEKRLQQMNQSLTLDKVVALLSYTIQAIKESVTIYVQDKETQQYILEHAERTYAAQLSLKSD